MKQFIAVKYYTNDEVTVRWDKSLCSMFDATLIVKRVGNFPCVVLRTSKRMCSFARFVAERNLGRKLDVDEEVHHLNRDPLDNRWCNLLVCSKSDHTAIHSIKEQSGMDVESAKKEYDKLIAANRRRHHVREYTKGTQVTSGFEDTEGGSQHRGDGKSDETPATVDGLANNGRKES